MIQKNLEDIGEDDLQALKDNSVIEKKTLEYKQALPDYRDSGKKEFLADVSSFANTSGGDLIFGIVEDKSTGAPKTIEGLDIENVGEEIRRMESIIRDGIQPRIPSINSYSIELSNSKTVLIIRIGKSWISPHRVTFKGHDKFFSRSSNGKYPMDVPELRVAFTLSESITEKIKNFRIDRISKIHANETPLPFYENAKVVLHLIPVVSFYSNQSYDIDKLVTGGMSLTPMNGSHVGWRYNLEGLLSFSTAELGQSYSYVQLYRNGIIETVDGLSLKPHRDELTIPSVSYETEVIKAVNQYIPIFNLLGIEPPFFLFLTLVGVKGYSMSGEHHLHDEIQKIDRDVLFLPEVVMERASESSEILKPCFDAVWNACGFPESRNFKNGKFTPNRS